MAGRRLPIPRPVGPASSSGAMTRFLDAALRYADGGWSIIPIRHRSAKGKEPACRSWKRYQSELPTERTLHRWFNGVQLDGLAVVLGKVSGQLVCRDFDRLDSYESWASRYSGLAATLPTVETARGRHVYFRGDLARIRNLADGELRGAGYCLLPPSLHPLGIAYRWTVPLPDRGLPEIDPHASGLVVGVTETTEQTEQTDAIVGVGEKCASESKIANDSRVDILGIRSVEEAISATLPTDVGQRNRCIFEFARTLKAIPALSDAAPADLRELVQRWHAQALPVIGTKPFEETWIDFLRGWTRVIYPKGTEPMAQIFADALKREIPRVAQQYEQPDLRILVALCRELQRAAGDGPFYLSCRTAARLLGVSAMTISRWLFLLDVDGILKVAQKGGQPDTPRKATRFRYIAGDGK